MDLTRSANGAAAGAAAALVWALEQPLDKALLASRYDDVELLGKAVARDGAWPVAGLLLHAANGAVFGAAYAQVKPFVPGPPAVRGALCGLAEHLATWPLVRFVDRLHPRRDELPELHGNTRAFVQSAWRHALFGLVLGELENRLNARRHEEPPPVPASSNGHGNIETATVASA